VAADIRRDRPAIRDASARSSEPGRQRHQVHGARARSGAGPLDERSATARRLLFSISDTGIGIPASKNTEPIFEASARRRIDDAAGRGTRTGPHDSVDAGESDGRTNLGRERAGHGSTFQFTATSRSRSSPPGPRAGVINLAVLIVDDNPVNRRIFHEFYAWQMKHPAVASGRAASPRSPKRQGSAIRFARAPPTRTCPDMDGFAVAEQMKARPGAARRDGHDAHVFRQFGDSSRWLGTGIVRI